MAGSIFWQELSSSSIFTVSTATVTVANLSSISFGNIDCRTGGTSGLVEKFVGRFDMMGIWNTTTGIAALTVVGDLFLVPSLDGTNFPAFDLSTTAGSGTGIGGNNYVGSFVANSAPAVSTATLFVTAEVQLYPRLYQVILTNRSGQTLQTSSNATRIRVVADQIQYT